MRLTTYKELALIHPLTWWKVSQNDQLPNTIHNNFYTFSDYYFCIEKPRQDMKFWKILTNEFLQVSTKKNHLTMLPFLKHLALQVEQTLTVPCPIVIGSIPQLSQLLIHSKQSVQSAGNGSLPKSSIKDSPPKWDSESCVQVCFYKGKHVLHA